MAESNRSALGFEVGALFVDTAESYGSEPVVGQALAGMRDRVFLASKVSAGNFHPAALRRSTDASLQRLKVEHLDLYQLHTPNPAIPIEETMGAMEELVDAGKIRFIGVSNFSVPEMKAAMRALRKHPLVANQVRYNLVDRTIESEIAPFCQANKITVIAYSPLGRELQRILDCDPGGAFAEVVQATGKTAAQVALNWCLGHEDVVVIPKGNSVSHIRENCGASGWRLTSDQRQMLDTRIQYRRRSRAGMLLRGMVPGGLERS
ncbi:MAG: aldo/keto reductase [Verrucomicrobiae bacterium]|nr:aldo/keto reductase [Verrucomicrobiae bacterium]